MHGARAQQAAPLREGTAHVGALLAAPTLTNCEQLPHRAAQGNSARGHEQERANHGFSHSGGA